MTAPSLRTLWLEAVDAANDTGELDVYALGVAVKLARNMTPEGERCHPSVNGLAERVGCSERRARAGLRDLEAAGFVITRLQAGPEGRNLYLPAVNGVSIVPETEQTYPPAPRAPRTDVPPARSAAPRHLVPPEHTYGGHVVPPKGPAPGAPEPSPTLPVDTFSLETYGGGSVENPAAAAAPGQGSLWLQPVEAPAPPAEGSTAGRLAARAAGAPRRRGGNAAGKPCECEHLVKEHGGSREGFACRECGCTRYVAAPNGRAPGWATATG